MTKLTAIGGHALVIDEKILSTLRISPDTDLTIFADGRRIVIEPVDGRPAPPRRREGFRSDPAAPPPEAAQTKLVAVGGGYGVIIAENLLEQLDFASDTNFEVSTDGHRILLERIPDGPSFREWTPFQDDCDDPDHPRHGPPRRRPSPRQMVRLPKKQPW